MTEPKTALAAIHHYVSSLLADPSYDPHLSTINHLRKILDLCAIQEQEKDVDLNPAWNGTLVISCDASIKFNPGGAAAIGVVVRWPKPSKQPHTQSRVVRATTINQAEYDAVYEGLNHLTNFVQVADDFETIEVRTDSQLAVKQLNGEWKCNDPDLHRRLDIILELKGQLEKKFNRPISFAWYPRNSTEDMKSANYLAQDLLGVQRH